MTTYRHVEHDGQRVVAERDVVDGIVVYRPLVEGRSYDGPLSPERVEIFDERLHPRGRGGRWINKLGGLLRRRPADTVIGTTPYLKRRDPDRRKRANRGRRTFAGAAGLHTDVRMRPLLDAFEHDAEKLAAEHHVEIVAGERNVGVFEGVFEPSYAIKVRGEKADIDSFNRALGEKYDQKAVVGFTPNRHGSDAEVAFSGGDDPDAFYRALVDIMGSDAGAAYDNGVWRVFVYAGDEEVVTKLVTMGKRLGMSAEAIAGDGDYFTLREGEG